MQVNYLKNRHIGLTQDDQQTMCQTLGVKSVDELISQTMPQDIRLKEPLDLDEPLTEQEHLDSMAVLAAKNLPFHQQTAGFHPRKDQQLFHRKLPEFQLLFPQ